MGYVEMVVDVEAMKRILEYLGVEQSAYLDSVEGLEEAYEKVSGAFKNAVPITSSLYIEAKPYCGECGKELTKETMWSEFTCKECAERLGLDSDE